MKARGVGKTFLCHVGSREAEAEDGQSCGPCATQARAGSCPFLSRKAYGDSEICIFLASSSEDGVCLMMAKPALIK